MTRRQFQKIPFPFLPFAAKSHRTLLRRGQAPVPCREEEGLCVRGLPAHPGQVHQHVCGAGRAEEHEVQRQERPLGLQKVAERSGA